MRGRILAMMLACCAQAAPADEPVLLRYRFRVGDRIDVQVAHRALTETTMNGVSQVVETQTDSTKSCRVVAPLTPGDRIRIRRARPRFTLVETGRHGYSRTLREKLAWGGGLRAAEAAPRGDA